MVMCLDTCGGGKTSDTAHRGSNGADNIMKAKLQYKLNNAGKEKTLRTLAIDKEISICCQLSS